MARNLRNAGSFSLTIPVLDAIRRRLSHSVVPEIADESLTRVPIVSAVPNSRYAAPGGASVFGPFSGLGRSLRAQASWDYFLLCRPQRGGSKPAGGKCEHRANSFHRRQQRSFQSLQFRSIQPKADGRRTDGRRWAHTDIGILSVISFRSLPKSSIRIFTISSLFYFNHQHYNCDDP